MIYVLEDQGARPYMEDRHYIEKRFFEDYDLYAVFDGHGNANVAKLLHLYFKGILWHKLQQEDHKGKALAEAFKGMNNMIPHEVGLQSGSTALVILQNPEEMWVANAGDCRVITHHGTQAQQASVDHKPNLDSEHKRIYAAGGFVINDPFGTPRVNGHLALSRAFGDFYLSPVVTYTPDVFHHNLGNDKKYVFVASDGIFDVLENQEIIDILLKHGGTMVRPACHELLQLARSRGSGDNITIIVKVLL